MNFVNIKDYFRNNFFLNFKINIILIIFYLSKLFIRYNIYIKTRDVNNIFK